MHRLKIVQDSLMIVFIFENVYTKAFNVLDNKMFPSNYYLNQNELLDHPNFWLETVPTF